MGFFILLIHAGAPHRHTVTDRFCQSNRFSQCSAWEEGGKYRIISCILISNNVLRLSYDEFCSELTNFGTSLEHQVQADIHLIGLVIEGIR